MSCYHPLPGFKPRGGGVVKIGYHAGQQGDKLELPCGRCIGCKLDKSRAWSVRVMHEAQLYDSNLFLTLDYAPEHLPKSLSLEYSDFQGFMRRLRKVVHGVTEAPNGKRPIRFFCSGEYGEQYGRPHWHAILFNAHFSDSVRYVNGTSRSSLAESLWKFGRVVIGEVTPESAAYVAGYTLSKVYGHAAAEHYEDVVNVQTGEVSSRRAPFCAMSLKPGIGAWWYEKYGGDLFPHDYAVSDGRRYKVPSYYWRKFQEGGDPLTVEDVANGRYEKALERKEDSTERRRSDREVVALAKVNLFSSRKRSGL